jgi:hypothetical protein
MDQLKKLFLLVALLAAAGCARAQNLGYVGMTNSNQPVFNAVSVAGPSAVLTNLGSNFHVLCYNSSSSTAAFQIRLEFSFTGSTSDYHALSDDGTSQTFGCVYGQGSYPFVRANLLYYNGSGTITANYTGIFSGSMPPTGSLNQSQQFRKILAEGATGTGASQNYLLNPPCANANGTIYFQYLTGAAAGSFVSFVGADTSAIPASASFSAILANTSNLQTFQVPSNTGTFIQVTVTAPLASTYTMQYIFNCGAPGGGVSAPQVTGLLQPITAFNSESVSATNAQVSDVLPGSAGTRFSIFSVNARCSAGTAGLSILNGATQIWSSGTAEVGTTTFKFQWSPGLAGAVGNGMTVILTACGAGNTGTLDVQASQN